MPHALNKDTLSNEFLDLVYSCLTTRRDKIGLLFYPVQAYSLRNKVNKRLETQFPDHKIIEGFVLYRKNSYLARLLVERLAAGQYGYYDLLTGIELENEGLPVNNRFRSSMYFHVKYGDDPTLYMFNPTLFDKYFEHDKSQWQDVSNALKICSDMAEERGFSDLAALLNGLSDEQNMVRLLLKIPRRLY